MGSQVPRCWSFTASSREGGTQAGTWNLPASSAPTRREVRMEMDAQFFSMHIHPYMSIRERGVANAGIRENITHLSPGPSHHSTLPSSKPLVANLSSTSRALFKGEVETRGSPIFHVHESFFDFVKGRVLTWDWLEDYADRPNRHSNRPFGLILLGASWGSNRGTSRMCWQVPIIANRKPKRPNRSL